MDNKNKNINKNEKCKTCNSNKKIIDLHKDTEQIFLCEKCFYKQYLQFFNDGWKNDDFEICENCDCIINYVKTNIYILTKLSEKELVWCGDCFDELWKDAYDDGWEGDDIEDKLEEEFEL